MSLTNFFEYLSYRKFDYLSPYILVYFFLPYILPYFFLPYITVRAIHRVGGPGRRIHVPYCLPGGEEVRRFAGGTQPLGVQETSRKAAERCVHKRLRFADGNHV